MTGEPYTIEKIKQIRDLLPLTPVAHTGVDSRIAYEARKAIDSLFWHMRHKLHTEPSVDGMPRKWVDYEWEQE